VRRFRHLAASALMLLLFGCSTQPTAPDRTAAGSIDTASACVASLAGSSGSALRELDARDFSIVSWNIQKGKNPDWVGDLAQVRAEPDLIIVQEASPHHDAWETLAPGHFRSFAEGFGFSRAATGVMTLSSAQPLTECDLVSHEPWFGTRKATLVTEYGLSNTDQTLLVVNIHGINFTLGVRDLKKQLQKAETIIAEHRGPVLFSGDFNTWRGGKARMLEELVHGVGLTALDFSADYRKRFFGWPLDHIYVRGLDTIHATTQDLSSSDHNPMSVRFRLAEQHGRINAAR